jgi:hypothetical protein
MASIITATTTNGLTHSADNSGVLQLASGVGNLVTVPSVTGTAMVSGNMPAFSAFAGTTTTLPADTATKVTFDTEVFDTNSNFASSRFTPTVAGYYQINACLNMSFWNGVIFSAIIYKNGSQYNWGQTSYPQTVGGVRASVSSIVYCNGSTDYIEIYGYQYAASSNNVVSASSSTVWFNGSLVRAA